MYDQIIWLRTMKKIEFLYQPPSLSIKIERSLYNKNINSDFELFNLENISKMISTFKNKAKYNVFIK